MWFIMFFLLAKYQKKKRINLVNVLENNKIIIQYYKFLLSI